MLKKQHSFGYLGNLKGACGGGKRTICRCGKFKEKILNIAKNLEDPSKL